MSFSVRSCKVKDLAVLIIDSIRKSFFRMEFRDCPLFIWWLGTRRKDWLSLEWPVAKFGLSAVVDSSKHPQSNVL